MGMYIILMILCSTVVLSALFYVIKESYVEFNFSVIVMAFMIATVSGIFWCFIFDVKNDTFYKPLKETLHIEYKNGLPTDTTYTYE